MLGPKPTTPRTRNYKRSWTVCSSGCKPCWNPIRTKRTERQSNWRSNRARLCPSHARTAFAKNASTTKPSSTPMGRKNRLSAGITTWTTKSSFRSRLGKGETVEVRGLAPEESCAHDMLVLIHWHSRNVAVPLSQLTAVDADESTVEAIADWHYWLAQGYCF